MRTKIYTVVKGGVGEAGRGSIGLGRQPAQGSPESEGGGPGGVLGPGSTDMGAGTGSGARAAAARAGVACAGVYPKRGGRVLVLPCSVAARRYAAATVIYV
eukprot:COSAG01_NODE_4032_length_5416_cov_11.025954_3_plen_101_part_00